MFGTYVSPLIEKYPRYARAGIMPGGVRRTARSRGPPMEDRRTCKPVRPSIARPHIMPQRNRLADLWPPPCYDEPPVYVVIGIDRARLLETREWSEAKGFAEQWRDLGFPEPRIVTKR